MSIVESSTLIIFNGVDIFIILSSPLIGIRQNFLVNDNVERIWI
jgi:hypothetical protein